ncbi:MAG: 50S ribosome-binding GTPase, partial [Patescibacteria group bacterium]|nr:50S ribosome-binding GTPase [Patescibacteria group bacterium]
LPSAGKSSLLNALTRAAAKVGDYPFTTLEPNLGDYHGYILADIPGLIEGAAEGKGIGTKFLKHIERTKLLIHLVSAEQADLVAAYREVRREIEAFGGGLAEKAEILVLAKADLIPEGERESRAAELARAARREVLLASAEDPAILARFAAELSRRLAGG